MSFPAAGSTHLQFDSPSPYLTLSLPLSTLLPQPLPPPAAAAPTHYPEPVGSLE